MAARSAATSVANRKKCFLAQVFTWRPRCCAATRNRQSPKATGSWLRLGKKCYLADLKTVLFFMSDQQSLQMQMRTSLWSFFCDFMQFLQSFFPHPMHFWGSLVSSAHRSQITIARKSPLRGLIFGCEALYRLREAHEGLHKDIRVHAQQV